MLMSQSKVLIVDDEPSIRKALHTTLNGLGFEIEEAAGGNRRYPSFAPTTTTRRFSISTCLEWEVSRLAVRCDDWNLSCRS
jgi:CheY-like chemotaxis protein